MPNPWPIVRAGPRSCTPADSVSGKGILGRGRCPEGALSTLLVALALGIVVCGAHDYAGSWNDASRFASVESLADRRTFAIDDSIFENVPPCVPGKPWPFQPQSSYWASKGTGDKVFIKGHYYASQGPVMPLLLAAVYQCLQWTTGITAALRPDLFCYALTVCSCGGAFAVAVWCVWRFGRAHNLPPKDRLALTAFFALGTQALAYVRDLNQHILLLGVAAPLLLILDRLAVGRGRSNGWALFGLGLLTGLGYTLDQGAGPLLLVLTGVLVVYLCRSLRLTALFALGVLPWALLHHLLTFLIGGTLGPYSAVPEHFQWPGSPFNENNLTGVWRHFDLADFLYYALGLLVDRRRGFLLASLPLFVLGPGLIVLWRRRRELPEAPVLVFALAWSTATWLLYALGSNNYAGICCSIRWFLPLLACGFYLLTVAVRLEPRLWKDLWLLSPFALHVGLVQWHRGAWAWPTVAVLWIPQLAAVLLWGTYRLLALRRQPSAIPSPQGSARVAA